MLVGIAASIVSVAAKDVAVKQRLVDALINQGQALDLKEVNNRSGEAKDKLIPQGHINVSFEKVVQDEPRKPKKLQNPRMRQLNGILKGLDIGGITGGKVAASMKSASDRAWHVYRTMKKNKTLSGPLSPKEASYIALILVPVKAFFTQIRTAGDMIVPLIGESLSDQSVGLPYLISFFASKDSADIQTYLEKIITTREALVTFCKEMGTFCGDIQESFSEDVLNLQKAFLEEQKTRQTKGDVAQAG